ncbi:hypothetical protein [uncultured Psychrobacter sp.]|uniref:hypothetical protein n=1 Tax=uncultured Psychrobacter sp. TaxID=259303 RepID=UPI00259A834F|nr:hypothetical protein [uncultured Psychrobacter sp.]
MLNVKSTKVFKSCDFSQMIFNKVYQSKQTLYLDQNIIDKIVDYPVLMTSELFSSFQVIYSDETLREIERSGDPNKFLKGLEELKARKIFFEMNSLFELTGNVAIKPYLSPFVVYEDFIARDTIDGIANNMIVNNRELIFNLFSRNANKSIKGYIEESYINFEAIYDDTFKNLSYLKDELPSAMYEVLEKEITSEYKEQSRKLSSTQNIMLDNMVSSGFQVEHVKGQEGIKALEKETGIDAKVLNNIKPPNVLKQIYQKYVDSNLNKEGSIDDFYLTSDTIFGRRPYIFEKVLNIYMMLNILGYKRDEGFHKKYRRFVSASSDGQHLAYACYCNSFYTEDIKFSEKAKAIFEFLNIGTDVVKISFNIEVE